MRYNPKKQELDLIRSVERISYELRSNGHKNIIALGNGNGGMRISSVGPDGKAAFIEIGMDGQLVAPRPQLEETIAVAGSVIRSVQNLDRALAIPIFPGNMDNGGSIAANEDSALLYLAENEMKEVV